jgi:hypothetical protein
MPRKKPAPSALSNALLAATIAELPMPARGSFPAADREAFINMLRGAMDVVYGPVERPLMMPVANVSQALAQAAVAPTKRYYVAPNSVVMCGGLPVKFHTEFPAGTILWDERTKPDRGYDAALPPMFGLTDNIEWSDIGTNPKGTLPVGMTMRPVEPGSASGPAPADSDGVMT